MQTKYIIKMNIPSRPDLDYYYCGRTREENSPLFDYRKPRAKRYDSLEEANKDLEILSAISYKETLTVIPIKCRK
jgi:hypothetical protein